MNERRSKPQVPRARQWTAVGAECHLLVPFEGVVGATPAVQLPPQTLARELLDLGGRAAEVSSESNDTV